MTDFAPRLEALLHEWIPTVTTHLTEVSKGLAPYRTGVFAASLYPIYYPGIAEHVWEIHSDDQKPKAIWIRDGTDPHPIFSAAENWTNRSALAFYWPKAGRTVFRMYVNHPGTRPNAWGDRVLAIVGPYKLEQLGTMIDMA